MEVKSPSNFWWMKQKTSEPQITSTPRLEVDLDQSNVSSSLADFLEKERAVQSPKDDDDTDIGSIIEEINRVAAQSPLGPYDDKVDERPFEDIMKEAEKVYMESSKNFEQLSLHSKTSANLSFSLSDSTPTPKSASPLPLDSEAKESLSYSSDSFEDIQESGTTYKPSTESEIAKECLPQEVASKESPVEVPNPTPPRINLLDVFPELPEDEEDKPEEKDNVEDNPVVIKLQEENRTLREDLTSFKMQLKETNLLLEKAGSLVSPEVNGQLVQTLEKLKDSQEKNTSLELQLDNLNKSHQFLKNSYDNLVDSNKSLEKRIGDSEAILLQCKTELVNLKEEKRKLKENEVNLLRQLEVEKTCSKSWKTQNEKDNLAIQDLTRQVKEMERIIARKHPDSVAALIVAAKNEKDTTYTTRKLLEDRIRTLELELTSHDRDSSRVFLEVQEKFSEMKAKYESHIEDLELHVNDLKNQLKHREDKFDIYTQTIWSNDEIPSKDTKDISIQTDKEKKPLKGVTSKEETHLLATIRGLQTDLLNKDKSLMKLQKDVEEMKKTNARLQKERETNLRNPVKKTSIRVVGSSEHLHEELETIKKERDKIRVQLCRLEDDYQVLKTKRLFDLNALQEVHESEIATYVRSIKPLSDQLETLQITIRSLQEQLSDSVCKLEMVSAERDQLKEKLLCSNSSDQKFVETSSCQKCAMRQNQLIAYKEELDHLLATLHKLT